ncbi:ABC transporter substrate-binding protein [Pusillimonas sp.]|uniref:ABC transporter substrate-binding protein n=1 Tax=Pusillimonas sp. TaxID=3040095 RepID=UPI0029B86B55|nr:ABC transporter substrate-binding protein [Pusillimonas sp.]MDX3894449.1 ABC transporter substrate-binding protein [Pusillimonas sp.]
MKKRHFLRTALSVLALAATGVHAPEVLAADKPFKVGLIVPMTGAFASTGRQVSSAVQAFIKEHGDTVAGRKVQVILKDDGGIAANSRKLAQELIVNDKVDVIAGFGLTPITLAVAPIATESKTPMVLMAAQTQANTEASPFMVRSSGTITQVTSGIAQWAVDNGIKTAVTLVPDYAPGYESEEAFKKYFLASGGKILDEIRVPMRNPDFAPFLQRVRDVKPDALFVMLPSGPGAALLKQYGQRGLAEAGIKLIGHGAITDDDNLNEAGDAALGVITSDYYATAHDSELNRKFIDLYKSVDSTSRPNFFGVAGYDGMRLIYEALKATDGKGEGMALVDAMKTLSFESPRGPVKVDPESRDFVQNIYMRKVEKVGDEYQNVEFDVIENVNASGEKK